MSERTKRLKDLAEVQGRIHQLHQARRATLLAEAHAAQAEAEAIGQRSYEAGSLSDLFPDLYARKVAEALRRRDEKIAAASAEGRAAATAKARAEKIAEAHETARAVELRQLEDRERLDSLEQRLARNLPRPADE
jgi:broad specificity phosphatase PhoE